MNTRRIRPFSGLMIGLIAATATMVTFVEIANAVPRKVRRECKSDYKSLCPHYRVGTSRMRACMRSKGRQLSWGCYKALKDYGYVSSRKRSKRRRRR